MLKYCPGSSQGRVKFCSSQDRVWLGPRPLSCTTSDHLPRTGGRTCFWTGVVRQREWRVLSEVSGVSARFLSLIRSIISIVAITVRFLTWLLFPVNCSYSWSLSFVTPILLTSPGREGENEAGREEGSEQHIAWSGFSENTKLENTISKPWQIVRRQ